MEAILPFSCPPLLSTYLTQRTWATGPPSTEANCRCAPMCSRQGECHSQMPLSQRCRVYAHNCIQSMDVAGNNFVSKEAWVSQCQLPRSARPRRLLLAPSVCIPLLHKVPSTQRRGVGCLENTCPLARSRFSSLSTLCTCELQVCSCPLSASCSSYPPIPGLLI